MFSYIRRLGSFFWVVQNLEFQYFWVFFSEKLIFLGYEDFVDMFFGSSQNRSILGVISMHFRSRHRMGDNFLGCKKFQIFFWGA